MEKLSHLAFHPVKMQSCYEKMEQLKLEGLQQRFDVSSTSVFKQRAQIHMRQVGRGPGGGTNPKSCVPQAEQLGHGDKATPAPSVLRVEPVDARQGCWEPCWCIGSSWCPSAPKRAPRGPPLGLTPWFLPQQMDDAVYTFETLLHQELGKLQGKDDLCKSIQRILERVLKVRAGVCSCLGAPGGLHPRARSLGMQIRSLLGTHSF